MTRTTWRSICHTRAVTPIALSLVRQSMDLGHATRAGAFCETKILTVRMEVRKIFHGLDEYFACVPKTGDFRIHQLEKSCKHHYFEQKKKTLIRPMLINAFIKIFVTLIS